MNTRSLLLFFCLIFCTSILSAQTKQKSPFDVSFLSCWQGKSLESFGPHSVSTPVLRSKSGYRVYATVTAAVIKDSCLNTTRLFVAKGTSAFKNVYEKNAAGTQDGNGIRLIGWSLSGDKFLAEVTTWAYGTDAGLTRIPLMLDAVEEKATEPLVDAKLGQFFGDQCEFDFLVVGWVSETSILLKVTKTSFTESSVQKFCVNSPRKFIFDVRTNSLRPTP